MSGHKRAFVRLSRAEYERLRDAASENRLVSTATVEPTPAQTSALITQSSSAIWEDLETVRARQNALEGMLGRFDRQVRDLEHATGEALLDQQRALSEEMQHSAGLLYQNADALMEDHLRAFRDQVNRRLRDAQSTYQTSELRWQRNEDERHSLAQTASSWLHTAEEMAKFICQNYPHELLAPGLLNQVSEGLYLAQDNMTNGRAEAALAAAQQSYLRLSELRIELERLDAERRILVRGVQEQLDRLIARAEAIRSIPAVDLDGQELGIQLEVDFWSGGGLSQVQRDLRALKELTADPLDIRDLEGLADSLPQIEGRLNGLIEEARLSVINSQLRFDIAEVVVSALSEQGFALEEGAYAAGDAREGYCVRLINAEGGEVEVHIAPRPGEALENDLHLLSHDAEARTRHELQARMRELSRSLSWHGLEVNQAEQLESGHLPTATKPQKRQTLKMGQ